MAKRFWQIHARYGESPVLRILDEVGGGGVQVKDIRAALSAVPGQTIAVEINSPGGDVFAGIAIYNMLRASGKHITARVTGIAASAASLIFMAGDVREMPANTYVFVHNPWTEVVGNADEMRETADVLDKIGTSLQATYVARTGQPENIIKDMLAVDTWMTADEARALGFATMVTPAIEAQASFDIEKADLPERVRAIFRGPVSRPRRTVSASAEIQALCACAKRPQAAAEFIAAGKTVAEVRQALLSEMSTPADSTAAIWAKRKKESLG